MAALESYSGAVQGQLRGLLSSEQSFAGKLEALTTVISEDPSCDHGCLFVKMRAARLDLGPKTQAKVAEIEIATVKIYTHFLRDSRKKGEWLGNITPDFAGQYLHAQIGPAMSQRALGTEPSVVRKLLEYALSLFKA